MENNSVKLSVKNKWIIIFKILAFNVEVALVRDQIFRNSGTTRIARLQFWKDAIDSIYGDGIIPRFITNSGKRVLNIK